MSDTELGRFYHPTSHDLRSVWLDPGPEGKHFFITRSGYSVYVSLRVNGSWSVCRTEDAPAAIQWKVHAFLREMVYYWPGISPYVFMMEHHWAGKWVKFCVALPNEDAVMATPGELDAMVAPYAGLLDILVEATIPPDDGAPGGLSGP